MTLFQGIGHIQDIYGTWFQLFVHHLWQRIISSISDYQLAFYVNVCEILVFMFCRSSVVISVMKLQSISTSRYRKFLSIWEILNLEFSSQFSVEKSHS